MFELNEEFDITVVSDIGQESRNALIIDGFYKNPDEVRQYCLDSPKRTDPNLIAGLPGSRVFEEDPRVKENLKPLFDKLKNQPLWKNPINQELWDSNWDKAGFMVNVMNAESMDAGGGIPHQDSFDIHFGSVIYLNIPEECQGGTRLYSYFEQQSFPRPDMLTEDTLAMGHEFNQLTKNRWMRSWVDEDPMSPWKIELEFEMVYNRCILYEADLLHSQWYSEGMFTECDRIAQVLFM
jgi:hypothetical protein